MTDAISYSPEAEDYLQALADELSISAERYGQAETSYNSIGEWLHRDQSSVRQFNPQVYVQGSFRLGTAIRPVNEAEDYDVDVVCEVCALSTMDMTQEQLKNIVGNEIKAYHAAKAMKKPLVPGHRCWTLEYADGAQFHMDILPCVPDSERQRVLIEKAGFTADRSSTAVAITDDEHPQYKVLGPDWFRSNPKGFADWFRSRMEGQFEKRRKVLAEVRKAAVEDIPEYEVRTPLQSAIMILKRHRDKEFSDDPDNKPISVIVTTLASHAYRGEESISEALVSILRRMDSFIDEMNGQKLIRNPVDPLENFADKWVKYPEREVAFYKWLEKARSDFESILGMTNKQVIEKALSPSLGGALTKRAAEAASMAGASILHGASQASAQPSFPSTRREPATPKGFA